MDITLLVVAGVCIFLLFIAMILSAMASMDAKKSAQDCQEGCHRYSMWSALIAGLSVVLLVVFLGVYIYVSEAAVRKEVDKRMSALHGYAVSKLSKAGREMELD
jgi:NADH:ubiquinone oxidoreductase subunit 5 (subunit L)/multisubunit Na+/H+ antiporter MnhA subunit